MLQPDPGQLLAGLQKALARGVLPKLEDAGARRQLKAALHMLGRLSRSWDLPHELLRADNEDIEQVLSGLGGDIEDVADAASGVNDPHLAKALRRNRALRAAIEATEARLRAAPVEAGRAAGLAALQGLCARMARRELVLVGDAPPQEAA